MSVENRKYLRVQVSMAVTYCPEGAGSVDAFIQTLGGGGVFIETTSPPSLGVRVKVELHLPGEPRKMTMPGKVVWIREEYAGDSPAGMGVQFLSIRKVERERLNEHILRVLRGVE